MLNLELKDSRCLLNLIVIGLVEESLFMFEMKQLVNTILQTIKKGLLLKLIYKKLSDCYLEPIVSLGKKQNIF